MTFDPIELITKVAAPVNQAMAVVVTAVYASKGLKAWRQQMIGKRRIEVAEEALVAAYKARANLNFVRSPFGFAGEGGSRRPEEGETASDTERLNRAFAPLERIQKCNDDLAEISKIAVLVQVHFGAEEAEHFKVIIQSFNKVAIAATMLMETGEDRDAETRGDKRTWRATIYAHGNGTITREVEEAITKIEDLCRRHLKD